jgi:hypothetical protein
MNIADKRVIRDALEKAQDIVEKMLPFEHQYERDAEKAIKKALELVQEPTAEEIAQAKAYVTAASELYHSEGDCEIDEPADEADYPEYISKGDDPGSYVKAWVWVSDSEAGLAPADEEDAA